MKAAFLVDKRTLEVREVPDPNAPGDGLVLKVEACGVCGSDLRRWKEGPPPGIDGITPGHEVAGMVIEVGANVTRFQVGDRLALGPDIHCGECHFCRRGMFNLCDNLHFLGITPGYPGGFAEKMVLTGEVLTYGLVHPMPPGLGYREAALAEPLASVLACHDKAATNLEDVVVVIGAGPTGCLHIMIAKARGAQVIVAQTSRPRRELASGFGPDAVVNPREEDLMAFVREFTGGLGATITICANPIAATQTQAVELTRKGGRIVLYGGLPKADPMTTLNANLIHYGEQEVVGAFSYHPSFHEAAVELIHRKVVPAHRLITHVMGLDDISQAFETAASGQGLKVIVES